MYCMLYIFIYIYIVILSLSWCPSLSTLCLLTCIILDVVCVIVNGLMSCRPWISKVVWIWIYVSALSLKDKLRAILKATYTHSRNLACFVFTYKGLQTLQQRIQGKSLQSHSFLAACVGGWLVFGNNNSINSQVGQASRNTPPLFL